MITTHKKILIAGSTGVVGRHLVKAALEKGWRVRILTRVGSVNAKHLPHNVETVRWDPSAAVANDDKAIAVIANAITGCDAVVNLAGATLADGRLDDRHKQAILSSRLLATRALGAGLAQAASKPESWIQASAVGYYGDTGEVDVDESGPLDQEFFLGEVCKAWEDAAKDALKSSPHTRLVVGRIGLVFASDAPALRKLVTFTKLGMGGPLGSGQQWWAWISAGDLARSMLWFIETPTASGVYNLVAPRASRQIEIAQGLGKIFRRPSMMPAPAFALRMVLGQVADALLLPSCKAVPARLLASGFVFENTDLESSLRTMLKD